MITTGQDMTGWAELSDEGLTAPAPARKTGPPPGYCWYGSKLVPSEPEAGRNSKHARSYENQRLSARTGQPGVVSDGHDVTHGHCRLSWWPLPRADHGDNEQPQTSKRTVPQVSARFAPPEHPRSRSLRPGTLQGLASGTPNTSIDKARGRVIVLLPAWDVISEGT